MDQIWAREHVLTVLKRRELSGEGAASAIELQRLAGMGPQDLLVTLGVLVDEGKVAEHGEGGGRSWELALGQALRAEAAANAEADENGQPPGVSGLTPAMIEAARVAGAPATGAELHEQAPLRRVTLTYSVVQAMHPDTIGAMIYAGCSEAFEAGAEFELLVTGP